jgi:hypothetical protein
MAGKIKIFKSWGTKKQQKQVPEVGLQTNFSLLKWQRPVFHIKTVGTH